MIRFLLKGLLRDRQRSLLPAIVVAAGVMLTVFLVCYLTGIMGDNRVLAIESHAITGRITALHDSSNS